MNLKEWKTGYHIMMKLVVDNNFKQSVINYVFKHPDYSKLSIAEKLDIADSTSLKYKKSINIFQGKW